MILCTFDMIKFAGSLEPIYCKLHCLKSVASLLRQDFTVRRSTSKLLSSLISDGWSPHKFYCSAHVQVEILSNLGTPDLYWFVIGDGKIWHKIVPQCTTRILAPEGINRGFKAPPRNCDAGVGDVQRLMEVFIVGFFYQSPGVYALRCG